MKFNLLIYSKVPPLRNHALRNSGLIFWTEQWWKQWNNRFKTIDLEILLQKSKFLKGRVPLYLTSELSYAYPNLLFWDTLQFLLKKYPQNY